MDGFKSQVIHQYKHLWRYFVMDDKEKAREEWSDAIAKRAVELDGEKMPDEEWFGCLAKWRKLNGFPEPETYLTLCLDPENWIKKAQQTTKF